MSHASNYVMFFRTILDTDLVDDQNSLALIVLSALRAWRGPSKMTNGIYPGESFLKRPARMSDKEYRAAKIRVAKSGLLSFRTVRNHTICCLTETCEKLVDPKIIWGEVRGEPSSAANPHRTGYPSHRLSLRGAPRGEVEASGANQLADQGEARGESRGELQLVKKLRPASDCGADKDSKGEDRGEVEDEAPAEIGRTLNKKENKNKDSSSWGDLLEALWAEVAPRRNAEKPPKALFQRKCAELLAEHSETTIRALIGFANAKADRSFIGHIEWAIKNGNIPDALDSWHEEMDKKRKAAEPSQPPPSPEEIAKMDRRNSLYASLVLARNRNDQAEVERLKALLDFDPLQLGQPTPCAHGAHSGAGRGLCPSEPHEDEDKEPKA